MSLLPEKNLTISETRVGGGGGAAAPLAAPARTPMAYGLCLEVQQHLVEVAIPVVVETIDFRVEQRKKL